MKVSERTGAVLFFAALFASFVMQYPLFKVHAGNWDYHFNLYLSSHISEYGTAPWIANWSSYFGLHRLSYPQGLPFLLSFFQQLSGEYAPDSLSLIYSYILGFMGVIFSFALGLTIRKKDYLFAFFLSFLFATAPSYLYVTEWTASGRGLLITLLPLYMMVNLFLFRKSLSSRKIIFLNLFFLALLFSIHRMAFFVLITAIPATVLTSFFSKKSISRGVAGIWWRSLGKTKKIALALFFALLFMYPIYWFYSQYTISSILKYSYTSGTIFSGSSLYIRLMNVAFAFVGSGGILVIFAVIPFYRIFKDRKIDEKDNYILLFFIFSFSIIFYKLYFRTYESLILSLFIALFMMFLVYNKRGITLWKLKIDRRSIVILLVVSLLFSGFMQARWDGSFSSIGKQWMDYKQEEVVDTVHIINASPIFVSSDDITRFVSLYSDQLSMSPGFHYYYAYTARGFISSDSLNITFSPQVWWSGKIFLYKENFNSDFEGINDRYHNLSSYDYFEIADQGNYTKHLSNKKLNIFENYKIYDSGRYSICFVDRTNADIERTKLFF